MWKRMCEWQTAIPVILGAIAWCSSWVLVYKFGWRYTDWLGFVKEPLPDNESFLVYMFVIYIILVPLGLFFFGSKQK